MINYLLNVRANNKQQIKSLVFKFYIEYPMEVLWIQVNPSGIVKLKKNIYGFKLNFDDSLVEN